MSATTPRTSLSSVPEGISCGSFDEKVTGHDRPVRLPGTSALPLSRSLNLGEASRGVEPVLIEVRLHEELTRPTTAAV